MMSNKPCINENVDQVADAAKHGYAQATRRLAELQCRLAELAGTGQLDAKESIALQRMAVRIWEHTYSATLCAVRDWDSPDDTWDTADNTYADGRPVIVRSSIGPSEASAHAFPHNRFLLRGGAMCEFPIGVASEVNPR